MLSLDLSDGSKLKADVTLQGASPAVVVTQTRPSDTGSAAGRVTIPLTDLKRLAQAVGAIVKIFRA